MVKNLIIAVLFLTVTGSYAQNGTISPYSFFGIGDSRNAGTIENQMMGGIGVYGDSIHINLRNPAAYSKLGIEINNGTGLTNYAAGISNRQVRLKTFSEEETSSTTNLDYLSLGFSLGKGWGIGFGITPNSSVGYSIIGRNTTASGGEVINVFSGEGGLNRVYLSTGYELFKDFSVGVTGSFNFGTLENERVQSVSDVQFGTRDFRTSKVSGMDFNYALYYTPTIKEKYTLFASARINTQANLASENSRLLGSFLTNVDREIETIDVDLEAAGLRDTFIKVPTKTTVGLGFGEEKKWFVGGEFSLQEWGGYSNDFLDVDNIDYQDAASFSLGGFFIPDYDAFNGYHKRIVYRAGLRYNETGMVIADKEINDFGITFGVGLPLGRELSNLNFGFEVGRRGTSAEDLVEESYLKINLGFSFNDLWFRKRKIN